MKNINQVKYFNNIKIMLQMKLNQWKKKKNIKKFDLLIRIIIFIVNE